MIYTIKMPQDQGLIYESFRYPAGEVQVRIKPEVIALIQKADEIHVWATIKNGEIMELAQLTSALHEITNTSKIHKLILPYLPYSRADRRFVRGDCFGLEMFTAMLITLNYDEIVTLDCHSRVGLDIIGRDITGCSILTDVSPIPLIETVIEELSPVTILLPDEGASRYGLSGLHCRKKRDPVTGKLSGFEVPAKSEFTSKNVLIVDDICDGGGTFLGIAEALKDYDLNLYLYVTHGIFSKGRYDLSLVFEHIYTTDSYCDVGWSKVRGSGLTVMPMGGTILANILPADKLWANGAK